MVYKKNFALAIKVKGKILREVGEQVFIPFGSEYSIVLKNLHSAKASVKVWVDGQLIIEGCSLIIKPNETVELERFIRNGNLTSGNKLKFIERTTSIENHRGIKIDDGLIRIEYQFEKPYAPPLLQPYQNPFYHQYSPVYYPPGVRSFRSENPNVMPISYSSNVNDINSQAVLSNASLVNDIGITVEGRISDQCFTPVLQVILEDEVHAMSLQLMGQIENNTKVVKPITVKFKPSCKTCGKLNKATSKFCSNCGTSLHLV